MSISRNGALPLGLAAAVIVAALVAGAILPGRATAQSTFSATLSGDAEVPAVTTDASGSFTATIADGALDFSLTSDATGITASHIHLGGPDENGGVVAFLFGPADPAVDTVDTSGTITVDDLLDVLAGDWDGFVAALNDGTAYVNVHTEANPPGEVRGQIAPAAEAAPEPEPPAPEPEAPAPTHEPAAAPDALPDTGSGGLAADGGGSSGWIWALLAAGLTLGSALTVRRTLRRRS